MRTITITAEDEVLTAIAAYAMIHGDDRKRAWHQDAAGERDRRIGKGLVEIAWSMHDQGVPMR